MAVARDLSDLPTAAATKEQGEPPDPAPTFLAPYFEHLRERNAAAGERAHAIADTRFRHSMAGDCARAIAYHALGVPTSNPMDLAGIVVTSNGTTKHDEIQDVLGNVPGFEAERPVQVDGLDGSGSEDGLLVVDGVRVSWEHKNVGGFAFKMAVGERGAAQGPKHAHKVQGALNALADNADRLVITYMTWEAISVQIAQRKGFTEEGRVAAQWTYERDEFEPWALAEVARVSGILELLDNGELPARKHPELVKGAVITDPSSGQWRVHDDEGGIVDTGSWWACGYCRWQDVCVSTAAGRQPVDEVAVTLGLRKAA